MKNICEMRLKRVASGFEMTTNRSMGTAMLTSGRASGRLEQPEPMIAIALSDVEYLMKSSRSGRSSRKDRQPGCNCCCHLASGVQVMPRTATFSPEGGVVTLTLVNATETRIGLKITCSDNSTYRVSPVYATVDPQQPQQLHIARVKNEILKKDRLCINMVEAEGCKDAREAFKTRTATPATINVLLEVREEKK